MTMEEINQAIEQLKEDLAELNRAGPIMWNLRVTSVLFHFSSKILEIPEQPKKPLPKMELGYE